MAKNNDPVMRVDKRFKDAMDDLARKQQRTLKDITRQMGDQMQTQLRERPTIFEPTFTLPRFNILKKKDKRGGVLDVLFVTIILFAIAIGFLFLNTIWLKIHPKIANLVSADNVANTTLAYTNTLASSLDNIFLIIFVFATIAVLILAFTVDFHPVFYFLFVIIMIIGMGLSAVFSNTYGKIQDQSVINASAFSVQNYVMSNLPIVVLGIGLVALVAVYIKVKVAQ